MIHWNQKVWSHDYNPILVPSDDPSLVGGWEARSAAGVLPDQSGNGKDGIAGSASQEVQTILGLMRRYLPSSSAVGSQLGLANDFPLTDLTVPFWFRNDLNASTTAWLFNYYLNVNDAWGVRISGGNSISIYDDIDNAGVVLYPTNIIKNKLHFCVVEMVSKECKMFIDGFLVGSGTLSSDFWSSMAATLYHGDRLNTGGNPAWIVGPMNVFNEAKDQNWVTQQFLKYARTRQFYTSWGAHESIVDETGGYLSNTPARIVSGSWRIITTTINGVPTKAIKNITAGRLAIPAKLFYATPTEATFGGLRFHFYKGAAGNNPRVLYIATTTGAVADAGQFGYYWQVNNEQTPSIREMFGGVTGSVANGTVGGFPIQTWTLVDLENRFDGQKSYHQNKTQDAAAIDNSYTESNYIVLDFDPDDMIGWSDPVGGHNIQKTLGPLLEAA